VPGPPRAASSRSDMAVDTPHSRLRFGVFEVDTRSGELRKAGSRIKLQDQPFKVLLALLEHPGEVVTREELRARVWPDDSFGAFDHGVNVAIAKLRSALGDSADTPRYVETLHRRGYRFVFPVEEPRNVSNVGTSQTSDIAERSAGQSDSESVLSDLSGDIAQSSTWVRDRRGSRWLAVGLIAITATGAAVFASRLLRHHAPAASAKTAVNLNITRVTNNGNVAYVGLSPDGRYMAYVLRGKAGLGLWMRVLGTQTDAQILPPVLRDFRSVTFSPDGTQLFFPRSSPTDWFYRDLFSMPVLGGTPRLLMNNVDSPVSFSPDGRQILFMRKNSTRNTAQVFVANSDGGGERLLLTVDKAGSSWQNGGAWSPDGTTVVVSVGYWPTGSELDAISLSDGSARKIYTSKQSIGRPVWLPEGDAIVAKMEDKNEHSQIWLFPYPQGEPRLITHDLEEYHEFIDATRDGKTIAAIAWKTINNIFVFAAGDASHGKQITFGEQDINSATLLPSGRILIHESGNPDGELWTMNADGTQRVLFSSLRGISFVSRCGSYIVFQARQEDTTLLIRTDADGLRPRTLTAGGLVSPSCSPSGGFVYYADWVVRPQRLLKIPLEGGEPIQIGEVPGKWLVGDVAISPDGKLLAFPYQDQNDEARSTLAVIPSDGGPPVKTFPDVRGSVQWSPNGCCIVRYELRDAVQQLVEQPLAGGKPRDLARFSSGRSEAFNWSLDGKWLYIAHGDVRSDAVLISNFR
jgi:DNA-binding winged helix-turn-helix (wHTH) protein/Tol biopolymer transport system component